jgi:hypothetical protein
VGKPAMKIANFCRRGMGKARQDVRFTLRQSPFAQVIEIKPDPMCRTVDWMNKT